MKPTRRLAIVLSLSVVAALVLVPTASAHADGLVGYWRFDEGSGTTATDWAHADNPGTISGATYLGVGVATANNADSLLFNNSDEVVVADASALDFVSTDAMTISLWINRNANPASGIYHILGKRDTSCGAANYQIARDSTNLLHFNSAGGIVSAGVDDGGSWDHIAVTYAPASGGTLKIYVNGVLRNTVTPYVLGNANSAPLTIGASSDCGNPFPGAIDEVRIYRAALSSAAVGALANYHNFTVALSPHHDINTQGASHTVTATVTPALSGIPVNFTVSGPNSSATTLNVYTDGDGVATLTYNGTSTTGNNDGITGWIDANNNGTLTGTGATPATDDPRDVVAKYWVNLATPDYNFCDSDGSGTADAINPKQTWEEFSVVNGVLYSSDVHINDTSTGASSVENVCLYIANVGTGDIVFTNTPTVDPFTVSFTPKGQGFATTTQFADNGFAGTFPSGVDFLGEVQFTNISLFKDTILNGHLKLYFTRGSTTYWIPIDVDFRG